MSEQRVIRLLIAGLVFLMLLIIGLGIFFGMAFRDVRNSIATSRDADIVEAIRSLRPVSGLDGQDGVNGADGQNGRNGTNSTTTVIQQPIKGDKGDRGEPGAPTRQVEFDGQGNWRYAGDEEWLPLFQPPPEEE